MNIVTISAAEKFNLVANSYDETFPQHYEQWEETTLAEMLGDISEKWILEIGCGTGRLLSKLQSKGAHVVGIDISQQMVNRCRLKGLRTLWGNAAQFRWEGYFDIVLAMLTLNYIENKTAVLTNIRTLLKPGGVFIMSSDLRSEDVAFPVNGCAVAARYYSLSYEAYVRLLMDLHFKILKSRDFYRSPELAKNGESNSPLGFMLKMQAV